MWLGRSCQTPFWSSVGLSFIILYPLVHSLVPGPERDSCQAGGQAAVRYHSNTDLYTDAVSPTNNDRLTVHQRHRQSLAETNIIIDIFSHLLKGNTLQENHNSVFPFAKRSFLVIISISIFINIIFKNGCPYITAPSR